MRKKEGEGGKKVGHELGNEGKSRGRKERAGQEAWNMHGEAARRRGRSW